MDDVKKDDDCSTLRALVSSTSELHPGGGANRDDDDMSELVPLLQRSRSQRFPPPSFALAPAVPLPLWQRVALSSLQSREASLLSQRKFRHIRQSLVRDLGRYHVELQERAEKQRQQQREARVRAGERVAAGVRRYWSRRGDAYQQLAKVEFDVMKHQHDRRKQEDLLRETEELTRKLLESIFSAARKQPASASATAAEGGVVDCSANGMHHRTPEAPLRETTPPLFPVTAPSHASFWDKVGDDDAAPIEAALSLLDTEGGQRPLRHYQRSALRWMVHLYENNLNGILADEMGLGKTVQTIALLCYFAEYHNDWGPHLIVVPTTVVLNWKAELERWSPGLKVLTYIGSTKERHLLRKGWTSEDAFHVCVTSYNLVVQDRKAFRRRPWGFLVLDEAHHVKNFMSLKWQSLFDLQAEYRLLLTGTPLQNSIMELWSLFHFLLPFASAFRSNAEFKEWFSNPMDEMITGRSTLNEDIVRRLQALIRPFMLRRLKKDVETQLPTKTEKVVLCHLSRRQRSLYDDYMQLAETRQKLRGGGGAGGVLSVLLALRKVCDHPDLFEERPTTSPLVLSYDAVVEQRVPREALLLDNDDRGRWRFPCFHVLDVNDDGGRVNSTQGQTEVSGSDWAVCERERRSDLFLSGTGAPAPWWLFLTHVERPDAPSEDAMASFAKRFSPTFLEGPLRRRREPAPDASQLCNCSAALKAAFFSVLAQARQQCRSRHHHTTAAQWQRYHAIQTARNTYVPPTCRLSLRQTVLAQRHPSLCPSIAVRAAALLPVLERVCVYVPAVLAAHPPRLQWSLPIPHPGPFEALSREGCAPLIGAVAKAQDAAQCGRAPPRRRYDAAFFLQEMWPIQVRRSFLFPDKRLLIHDCGKLQFLETALKKMRDEGHRMLIFTQFVHMLNILERFLALIGIVYTRLDGSTKAELRQQYVDRFNADPRITCMILSTRSGGIGLNLTGADTVIFYDSDWNPTIDLQAQDRCHRIGQTRPVTIYRLISEHTVEESILEKARERKKLNNVVIRGGQFHTIAGVSGQYDDSAAAFAALSNPVNLRSFFHDLDEDATVASAPSAVLIDASDSAGAASSRLDVLEAMADVEDAEDRAAGQELQREIAAHAAEEAKGGGDDDSSGLHHQGGTLYSCSEREKELGPSAACVVNEDAKWQTRLPNSFLDALLLPSTRLGSGAAFHGSEGSSVDSVSSAQSSSAAALLLAVRKRQREIATKAHAPVDQFLAFQYARCHRADAEERYNALVLSYGPHVNESVGDDADLEKARMGLFQPRFRVEYRLGP
ncbi:SWI/SNF-related helicase [Leishmania donovani]|uniref:SWI/SNF-related_helicase_putative/GeneDB:LmjF.36. 5190 n=1 Tax=Leishmania donovani TaxID=5661 RepID=A0A6J8FQU1_LEIDO|nr:SWI/SNF-related helicase [Leishmania donovani]VDZ49737.1 SWI/SNF-related_helicase_putative/GeneDB:LmjF.36.5190 [Leishmania donovani]